MRSGLLFLLCTMIWGTTWLAIKFQVSSQPGLISVFYRFALASSLVFIWQFFVKSKEQISGRQQIWLFLFGTLQFGLNFRWIYQAEALIPSGLVAVTFTLVPYFNLILLRVFLKERLKPQVLGAVSLGGFGIILIFWQELNMSLIDAKNLSPEILQGLGLSLLAVISSSIGTLIARKCRQEKIPIFRGNAWAMLYGSLVIAIFILSEDESFQVNWNWGFTWPLLHLAILGSIVAYGAYLHLIGTIGLDRASYVNVMTPVLALTISSFAEGFHWTWITTAGVILCLSGQILILQKAYSSSSRQDSIQD